MKTINISKQLDIKIINSFKNFLNPEYLYVPIENVKGLKVNKNQNILKNDILYSDEINKIYSPISGLVKDLVIIKNKKFMLLKNDYKETSINNGKSRRIKGLTKEIFLSYIKDNYIKNILSKNINYLYINCIDNDPYIFNRYYNLKENLKDILEMLQNIANIFKIKKVILVLKDEYEEFINYYSNSILETGNIEYKIINGIYPIGNDDLLSKYLIHNELDALLNIDDINKIIYDVKKNRPLTEKFITINGNNLKNPYVLKVKKYTLVLDILKNTGNVYENVNYLLNNSLCGNQIDLGMTLVDDNFDGVIINKNNNLKEIPCNKCGLCYNVCPYKINPLIKNNKCIKCGLCNYVCPHKINVVERYQK